MPECRLYVNREHLGIAGRSYLNDLCRALWNDRKPDERLAVYGVRARDYPLTEHPEEADFCLLPLTWKYYVEHGRTAWAAQEALQAARHGKRLIVFGAGDFPANIPFENVILFESAGYASRRGKQGNFICGLPAFCQDYLMLYCQGQLQLRKKGKQPLIGFCGQANGSWLDFSRREALRRWRWFAYRRGWFKWEPPPFETTRLRKHVLNLLAGMSNLQTNFILRKQYRAGYRVEQKDPFHPTRLEFVRNILDTDYTLCVRGGGNFSVRFYETLSLGRIPVFVNTDCLLPFDDIIDYRQYCIWVEESEIPFIGEKVLDFHRSLSPARFQELQMACRELWQGWLSMDGFYSHLAEYLNQYCKIP